MKDIPSLFLLPSQDILHIVSYGSSTSFISRCFNNPRDFHEDLKVFNEVRDPRFNVEQSKMWIENMPTSSKPLGESQLQLADGKINQLVVNQTKLQFEADALSLARDASQLANLYNAEMQSERSTRMARIMHLKQENQIGSAIVTNHMATYCAHGSGPMTYLHPYIDKVDVAIKK